MVKFDDAARDWRRLARLPWALFTLAVLGLQLFFSIDWLLLTAGVFGTTPNPPGLSFTIFWSASWLALHGHAADAYTLDALYRVERSVVPWLSQPMPWFYPLPFYLLVLPLALLPYLVAYVSFALASLTAFVLALRRHVRGPAWLGLLAAPAVWSNLMAGQNALLTAAIGTSALLWLPRRPRLAGALLGLLVIKPQLGLLFPLALLAVGAWSALWTAGLVALTLLGLAYALLGPQTWAASLGGAAAARQFLQHSARDWPVMPTTFATLRLHGGSITAAYAAQGAVTVVCALVVWWVWRRSQDPQARAATLLAAVPLASPYLFHYDLAWLAFPLLWCTRAGLHDGWRRGEPTVLLAVWLLPLLLPLLGLGFKLQLIPAPLLLALLLGMVARRALRR